MKKLFSLLLILICGFGFVGVADAATTTVYKEKISKNESVELYSSYNYTDEGVIVEKPATSIGTIYYADDYRHDDFRIRGDFELQDPTSITIEDDASVSVKNDIVGSYTLFLSGEEATGDNLYYVESYNSETNTYECIKYSSLWYGDGVYVASSYKFNEKTGKYTLVNPKLMNYSGAEGMYTCDMEINDTCYVMYKILNYNEDIELLDKADVYTSIEVKTNTTTQTTTDKNTSTTTSDKNGTVQTTKNPNTGINDYIMYLVPIALAAGSVIVMKKRHA